MIPQHPPPPRSPDDEAADWMVRRVDGLTAEEEAQFQAWLAADASHAPTYERMLSLWNDLGALAPSAQPVSVVAPSWGARLRGWWSGPIVPQLATAVLAFAVVGAGWWGFDAWRKTPTFDKTYATVRGEQKIVRLPDGSTLWLDTATEARVTFHRDRREVQLPEGQAMFAVQHDADKPFDVLAGPARVTVLGTRFSVRYTRTGLHENGVSVAVDEGKVRVAPLNASPNPNAASSVRHLLAGDSVLAGDEGVGPVVSSGAPAAPWRDGRVTFDKVTLAQALAELDRYREGRLRIRDPQVAGLHISGSFDLRHLDAFERVLPQVLPVALRKNGAFTDIVAAGR